MGIKFVLISQILLEYYQSIINFHTIGKIQKWHPNLNDGLSLQQNIRNMLKFSI